MFHVCQMCELERAVLGKGVVFMRIGLRYNVRRCGSVQRGVLFWSRAVGPAWCSLVRMAFG